MKEANREETIHKINKLKVFINKVDEKIELSPVTNGSYKEYEQLLNDIRLELDNIEDNVRYSE